MKTEILRVVSQGNVSYIPSQKEANGQLAKCDIRLKKLGGSKFGDEFIATLFGNLALCKFDTGRPVVVSLRFQTHEANGAYYQDVVATEIEKLY